MGIMEKEMGTTRMGWLYRYRIWGICVYVFASHCIEPTPQRRNCSGFASDRRVCRLLCGRG